VPLATGWVVLVYQHPALRDRDLGDHERSRAHFVCNVGAPASIEPIADVVCPYQ